MVSLHTSPLDTPGVGDAGGLNVYVAEVAHRLGQRGVEVDIFTRRTDDDVPEVVEAYENVRVRHLKAGDPALPKEQLPEIVEEFAEQLDPFVEDYDLIHSHYWLSGLAGLRLADRHDLPLVHTMHTMARVKNASRGNGHRPEPDQRVLGESRVVRGAQVLTANTRDEAEQLRKYYAARSDQLVVVPPGVDLHVFHPCDQPYSRELLGLPQDGQIILFVGRIQPLKAPDVLINAIAHLVRQDPSRRERLRLIIIGSPSGPDAAWAATLPDFAKSLDVEDLIEFRPHSPREELFRWYCASDVVGVPSYNESFGLVALEAQACGRPVVATNVGGLRHAVHDHYTGLLVRGHNPERWAEALSAILDDAPRAAFMRSSASVHASRFSWDNTAAATLEAYHQAQEARAATDDSAVACCR